MKKILLIMMVLLAAMPVVSWSMGSVKKDAVIVDKRVLAAQLVTKDLDAFTLFSRLDFADRVDREFVPDASLFLNVTEDAFLKESPQKIMFTLDEVNVSGDKLDVSFRWIKKAFSSSGAAIIKEGDAHIVYIQRDADWLIYQVTGISPFTL